ncbi:MAG: hypothetical protein ABEN55_10645 [Bradymonadaceae bacterium]
MIDGSVHCWTPVSAYEFETSFPVSGDYREVAAGGNHGCARRSDGGIDCWGGYKNRDLGIASPPEGSYGELDAGQFFTGAIADDGTGAVDC